MKLKWIIEVRKINNVNTFETLLCLISYSLLKIIKSYKIIMKYNTFDISLSVNKTYWVFIYVS